MQITKSRIQYSPTTILIVVGVLLYLLSCPDVTPAFDFHLDSAHGNNDPPPDGYGVNRSEAGHDMGDCANCHDTFDDTTCVENQLMLFVPLYTSQSNNVCLWCHIEPESQFQQQIDMPQQWALARKFGGATPIDCPDNIRNAFMFIDEAGNPISQCSVSTGSAHHLPTVRAFLLNKWGFGSTLANINPCEACHNPHKAQRHNYPVDSKGTSPISLPSTHDGNWDVYGAETTERMDMFDYQAPYYWGSTTKYESLLPGGDWISDGSNRPAIGVLCCQCHWPTVTQIISDQRNTFTSNYLGLYIKNPNYDTSPHGGVDAPNDSTQRKPPYNDDRNYVIGCTDCHEPHGSHNRMLIRRTVNGGVVTFTNWATPLDGNWTSRRDWISLCERCHNPPSGLASFDDHVFGSSCHTCHTHWPNASKPF